MTEITDLSTTDSSNTTVTGESIDGAIANMGRMDNTLQAILGLMARSIRTNVMRFVDNTDDTKRVALDLSGLPTATTNTIKLPSGQPTYGQCRLALDGSNIKLSPYNGNLLTINGYGHPVPSVGVTLAPSGLTPSTLYYIYAYMSSGTMTLEASVTGHSTDSTTGVEIKTGDATRSLVGMVYVGTGPAFNDSALKRHVVSWYNRVSTLSHGVLLTAVSIGPTTYTQINSTALQQSLLLWAGQAVEVALTGAVAHDVAGVISTAATLNTNLIDLGAVLSVSTTNSPLGIGSTRSFDVGYEGLATFDLVGKVSGGTGTWLGSSSADPARISLSCKAI